jgi:hypothetical protein
MPVEEIARITELSVEKVQAIVNYHSSPGNF